MNSSKILYFTLLMALFINLQSKAQLVKIRLDTCIKESTVIFEGKVISSKPFWGPDSSAYTSSIVSVSKVFKGEIKCGSVEIITYQSADIDNMHINITDGSLSLFKGLTGMFMCIPSFRPSLPAPRENPGALCVYAGVQGIVSYDIENGDTVNISVYDTTFSNTKSLYKYISSKTKRGFSSCNIAADPQSKLEMALTQKNISVEKKFRKNRPALGHNLYAVPDPVIDFASFKVLDTGLVDIIINDYAGKTDLHLINIKPETLEKMDLRTLKPGKYFGDIYTRANTYYFQFVKN